MWQCSHCQETVEDDFDVCWNCCASRTGIEGDTDKSKEQGDTSWVLRSEAISSIGGQLVDYRALWASRLTMMMKPAGYLPCAIFALLIQIPWWFLPTATAGISWNYSPGTISYAIFGISLFVPRAMQQQDWKNLPAMALFGAIAPFIVHWGMVSLLPHDSLSLHRVVWPLSLMILVAVAEWLRSRDESLASLLIIMVPTSAAAFFYGIASFFLEAYPQLTISYYLTSALLPILLWTAIPFGFWLTEKPRLVWRTVSIGVFGAMLCLYIWTFTDVVYRVATDSFIKGRGLFSKEFSARLLGFRSTDEDLGLLLAQLDDADWVKDFQPPYEFERDWRETAVRALIRHDEAKAAEELSKLLRRHPSQQLIELTKGLFIRQRRFETAPIYLRYAELESHQPHEFDGPRNDRYKAALDQLAVPEVAHAWIRDSFYSAVFTEARAAKWKNRPVNLKDEEIPIDPKVRPKLTKYLGEDGGEFWMDWVKLYRTEIHSVPSPLGGDERAECQRIVKCFEQYDSIVQSFGSAIGIANENGVEPPKRPRGPTWDVPTIKDLESEVEAYGQRVDRVVAPFRQPEPVRPRPVF